MWNYFAVVSLGDKFQSETNIWLSIHLSISYVTSLLKIAAERKEMVLNELENYNKQMSTCVRCQAISLVLSEVSLTFDQFYGMSYICNRLFVFGENLLFVRSFFPSEPTKFSPKRKFLSAIECCCCALYTQITISIYFFFFKKIAFVDWFVFVGYVVAVVLSAITINVGPKCSCRILIDECVCTPIFCCTYFITRKLCE